METGEILEGSINWNSRMEPEVAGQPIINGSGFRFETRRAKYQAFKPSFGT